MQFLFGLLIKFFSAWKEKAEFFSSFSVPEWIMLELHWNYGQIILEFWFD